MKPWIGIYCGLVALAALASIAAFAPPETALAPAGVTDLRATPLSDSALVLTWTEVNSSISVPARYAVRVDSTFRTAADFPWGTTKDVVTGGCAAPVVGQTAGGGKPHACVLAGLRPHRQYSVRLISYTGTLNVSAVFGPTSNVAVATTAQRIGPMLVIRPPMFLDTIAIAQASLPYDFGPTRFPVRGRFPAGDRVASFFDSTGALVAYGYLLLVQP